MTRMPSKALMWIANLLVPGAGFIILGRVGLGVVWALLWGSATVHMLLGIVWPEAGAGPLWCRVVLAAAVYAAGQAILGGLCRSAARNLADDRRDDQFKAALAAYLQGRLDESESLCRDLLKTDPDDVEATLQLGYVARQRGDLAAARRWFTRARYLDDAGKWDFQIGRELAACTQGPGSVAGRGP
jgi:tetratricopeptide (TPR) repeat protein